MNQVMTDIWPILLGVFFSSLTMYVGFINKMRSDIAVLKSDFNTFKENVKEVEERYEEEMKKFEEMSHKMAVIENSQSRIESRQDSHSKKYDELLNLINEIKLEMVKQFGNLASEMTSFSAMVEASDKGVKVNKRKK